MTRAELATWASTGASLATALTTVVLAWLTWVMAVASKRMAEATRQPAVVVTIEPSRWSHMHVDLVVQSTGNAPAFDIDISFEPTLTRDWGGDRKELDIERMTVMRPGATINNFVGETIYFIEHTHRVTVSWADRPKDKRRETLSYALSLAHLRDSSQLGSGDPQVKIAQELEKLRKATERLAQGSGRLKVETFDHRDRTREREGLSARFARERAHAESLKTPDQPVPMAKPKSRRRKPTA